jgi:hypothetical protein
MVMQTFLPDVDFAKSASVLDMRRLGKQRVETLQLVRAIMIPGLRWASHPACKMWSGSVGLLIEYGVAICDEWLKRGYRDSVKTTLTDTYLRHAPPISFGRPHWLGQESFHASHRAALLAKDPDHYGQFGWTETPVIAYVWPGERSTQAEA